MLTLDIDEIIVSLSIILKTDQNKFENLSKEKASDISVSDLPYLKSKLHDPPELTLNLKNFKLGLGEWLAMCQYAIFELLYNTYDYSLPIIKDIAFGPYDWTQATALEVLCRLYVNGKISESILIDINKKLSDMQYETHLYFSRALLLRVETDKKYEDILKKLDNKNFKKALLEIQKDLLENI
ncbi:hypothetical protein [Fusobacterium sp. PH5-44]|uniref:hypothetical protein n=1 Tax=unclassified Fusobacterium TaxID=2648384 RepID=UPI003D25141C